MLSTHTVFNFSSIKPLLYMLNVMVLLNCIRETSQLNTHACFNLRR